MGATDRCKDCNVDCPFNATKFYISRIPGWPSNILHPNPTEENIMEVLATTDYGRCVYKMDNDVVDHQTLNICLEDGITTIFSMSGFSNKQTRTIRIQGTTGEIWGDFKDEIIHIQNYNKEETIIDLNRTGTDFSGHGGGDAGLIKDVISYIRGDSIDSSSLTSIDISVASHTLAFAAEKSRLKNN